MSEIWKDVVGFEGIYEVSNHGRIRSKEGKVTHSKKHGKRVWKSRILKDKTPNGREYRVTLWKDKKPYTRLAHRVVAEAFLPKVEGKNSINHKDGNPKNNHVENLEWCTHLENNRHAFENQLIKTSQSVTLIDKKTGEKHYFYSKSKASEFAGKNKGYISSLLKRGKDEMDDYYIK
jgi:hypothetical protein